MTGTMAYRAMVVGQRSGLLHKHLSLAGISPENICWVTPEEDLPRLVAGCRPKAILSIGAPATKALTGYDGGLGEAVGTIMPTPKQNWPVIPCWNASYVDRQPMKEHEFGSAVQNWAVLVRLPGRKP